MAKRRANIYRITSAYMGKPQDDMIVSVYPKNYVFDDTQRGLITTPIYPCYISRKETAELLLQVRARSRGSVLNLEVAYTRTIDYRD